MSYFLFHGRDGDVMLPKLNVYGLGTYDKDKILIDKKGSVIKCYVCGFPCTNSMTVAIGGFFTHHHVKLCESLKFRAYVKKRSGK